MIDSDILGLLCFIAVNFMTACSGAFFRPGQWYEDLAKPFWRPPNWLFAPAWLILYATIAVSGWMVWRTAGPDGAGIALAVYGIHLLFNFAWSPIFFGLQRPDLAFAELVLMWLSLLATIIVFHPINETAAYILLPYLAWVTFAGALNYSIWQLNKEPLSN